MNEATAVRTDIASRLGTFRPSDRIEIARTLRDPLRRDEVSAALHRYVEGWESANWLEDYAIERIGKWFAISADPAFVDGLRAWSRIRQTRARKALLRGLKAGALMSADEKALANRELNPPSANLNSPDTPV